MKGAIKMIYSKELENMCCVAKGVDHGPAPIPEEGKWVKAKDIKDISYTQCIQFEKELIKRSALSCG